MSLCEGLVLAASRARWLGLVGDGATLLDLGVHLNQSATAAVLHAADILHTLSLNVVALADNGANHSPIQAAEVEEAV